MGRRKHAIDDTYSSSDEEQPPDRGVSQRDLEDEAEQFRDPMHRKRSKFTKEDAIYGYGWESDDQKGGSQRETNRSRARRKAGINFVAAATLDNKDESGSDFDKDDKARSELDDDGGDSDREMASVKSDFSDEDGGDDDEARREREAAFKANRERDQEEIDAWEDRPKPPGMGSMSRPVMGMVAPTLPPVEPLPATTTDKDMAASIRAGLGQPESPTPAELNGDRPRSISQNRNNHGTMSFFKNRAGIGESNSNSPSPRPSSPASNASPRPDTPVVAPVKVDKSYGAFSAKGSGFGLKMLEKMGWKKGYGLGAGGAGIVEPIQTKQRPVKMGIGFRGFKEKTDQDRAEEKRRGLAVSSDEDEKPSKQKAAKAKKEKEEVKADGWKQNSNQRSRKGPKVVYKTVEELQMEIDAEDQAMSYAQPQKILDMTGKTVREISSASLVSSSLESHVYDTSAVELERLMRKQKADHVRRQFLEKESIRLQQVVSQDERNMERLQKVMAISDQCAQIAKEVQQASRDTTGAMAIDLTEEYVNQAFREPLELFSGLYFDEYQQYDLDQVVIAALQESFKELFRHWDVLKDPKRGSSLFQRWRKLLKMSRVVVNHSQGPVYDERDGAPLYGKTTTSDTMTAYESLLYHHWLPKVRSAISNQWKARDSDPVVALLEAWSPAILPAFIQDNIVTQLVLPKLHKEVQQWTPRDTLMIHTWIHPWLPILGEDRLEQELFGDIRRKLAAGLSSWTVLDPSALRVLEPWRTVFDPTEMEQLLLKSVLPKLQEGLRAFEVNPRNQKIEILQAVLPWYHFFPGTTFAALLVNDFFPKWHQVLYLWLTHPSETDTDQVSQWYQWWKNQFPEEVLKQTAVATGFRRGLDMINQSMSGLQIMAPADVAQAAAATSAGSGRSGSKNVSQVLGRLQINKQLVPSMSFKDLVQDYATQNSLLFVVTKHQHEKSGRALYRLGGNSTGTTGGVLVHMTEEVAFVKSEETGIWQPVGLEELMVLAGGGKRAR